MNDSTPHDPAHDAPIEARIVSWVLGEASAFEAAELERLCEERPELLIFRRRMRALHGLLTEAESAAPDLTWALPVEKRRALDEIFGQEKIIPIKSEKEKRISRSGRRVLLAIAACVVLALVATKFMGPTSHIGPIKSTSSSDKAALPTIAASPAPSQDLAKVIRDQEDKVEERRRVLATIARTKAIVYKGKDSFYGASGVDEDQGARTALEVYHSVVQEKMQLESQLTSLLKYDSDQLIVYAAGLDLPDNAIKSLYPQYLERKLQLDSLKSSGLGERNPTVLAAKENVVGLKGQLDEGVVNLRATLQAQLAMAEERLKSVELRKEDTREGAIKRGLDAQDYADARRDFESDQRLLDSLKLKQAEQKIAQASSSPPAPTISELAEIVEKPATLAFGRSSESSLAQDAVARSERSLALAKNKFGGQADGSTKLSDWGKSLESSEMESSSPQPPATPAEPADLTAAAEPYSTFSLNISDTSFQLAKASLEKGEQPDPGSIKPEQFYNAVDYGDPAPASNEPIAATIEQAAHPIIPNRNIVRIALKTAAAGRGASQPLRLTLLVDQSGSMVREDRRAAMTNALKQLGGLLSSNDHLTVIGFSRESRLLADSITGDQAGKLGDLINQTASEGGTNLEEALKLGEQMAVRHQTAGEQNRLVLFTDGAANLGNADPQRLADRVMSLRQQGIAFDIAGIGADGLNDRLLSELARNGNGRYYLINDDKNDSFARQLAGAFRPAAENVKVQVRFNPERVGSYKLIGFEKDRLQTEDFRNDAVDAAELAAEEAGVAIYQVETIPQGTGEIGEVSVRFRDTSNSDMVERKWTLPFESTTQSFDRASPSMQLAGLSMLAAEKLRGGPLAQAIDFKQLSSPRAAVKQFYGSSPRIAEMLWLIDKLE